MPRKSHAPRPIPTLQFAGLSEDQVRFLRLRAYDESDAQSARATGLSPRLIESWKKRNPQFMAMHSFATTHPRLFSAAQFGSTLPAEETPRSRRKRPSNDENLRLVSNLYVPKKLDEVFERELRTRQLAASTPPPSPPAVDLKVLEQHRRVAELPRPMGRGEQKLAQLLGVEELVVLGYWNGCPTLRDRSEYEKAVDTVSQFTPGFRIEAWYPSGVVMTTAGAVIFAHGDSAQNSGCPLKSRGRCPLVDRRAVNFGACVFWDLALETWLEDAKPSPETPRPICHRDFLLTRLAGYTAAATMRGYGHGGGWSAGFPVIAVRGASESEYWEPRVVRWNRQVLDPWHRVRLIDLGVLVGAIADLQVAETLARADTEQAFGG